MLYDKKGSSGGLSLIYLGIFISLIILLIISMYKSIITVPAGNKGVIMHWGAVQNEILDEGMHFIIPFMTSVKLINVQIQKSETDSDAATKDMQTANAKIAVNYRVMADKVNWVYKVIGVDFKARVIDPAVEESVKATTAKYTAEELISKREEVSDGIKSNLTNKLIKSNIEVTDFSIVDFKFSNKFSQAIEDKQTAEQQALKAERDLDRIKIEADQKIEQAKAEAESLRLQRENVTDNLIKLREIEASIKAIEKWDGRLPSVVTGTTPFIDITKHTK